MLGPESKIRSIARSVDDLIGRTESVLVATAAFLMTATVSLDIIQRAFARPESKLGEKILSLCSVLGVAQTEENKQLATQYLAPMILGITVILAGWAVYAASQRHRGQPAKASKGIVWGLITLALSYGLIQGILTWSSRWVCFALMLLGVTVWFIQRLSSLGMKVALSCFGTTMLFALLPLLGTPEWAAGVCFFCFAAWSVYTDPNRWDVAMMSLMAVAGWFGCQKLPPETITGGMKLGYVWSQELALILLAWLAFIGASMATRAGRHIQVDALSKILPQRVRPWARAVGLLASALFCAYLTWLAYAHIFGQPAGDFWTGEIRPATRLPAWIIILAALVSFGLMTLRFASLSIDAFAHPRIEERELAH